MLNLGWGVVVTKFEPKWIVLWQLHFFYIYSVLLLLSNEMAAISMPSICYAMCLDWFLMWWLNDLFIFKPYFLLCALLYHYLLKYILVVHLRAVITLILHACYDFKSKICISNTSYVSELCYFVAEKLYFCITFWTNLTTQVCIVMLIFGRLQVQIECTYVLYVWPWVHGLSGLVLWCQKLWLTD